MFDERRAARRRENEKNFFEKMHIQRGKKLDKMMDKTDSAREAFER